MSASAEVHISVAGGENTYAVKSVIEDALVEVGFDTTRGYDFSVWHGEYGSMYDARSHSCSWEVFRSWADQLVEKIYKVDPEANVDVYVYNLDRAADVVASTKYDVRKEAINA